MAVSISKGFWLETENLGSFISVCTELAEGEDFICTTSMQGSFAVFHLTKDGHDGVELFFEQAARN